jgi:hypothetical protein
VGVWRVCVGVRYGLCMAKAGLKSSILPWAENENGSKHVF